jgi:hypothetical protein
MKLTYAVIWLTSDLKQVFVLTDIDKQNSSFFLCLCIFPVVLFHFFLCCLEYEFVIDELDWMFVL